MHPNTIIYQQTAKGLMRRKLDIERMFNNGQVRFYSFVNNPDAGGLSEAIKEDIRRNKELLLILKKLKTRKTAFLIDILNFMSF